MRQEKIKELLEAGEGFTMEYKECVNGLNNLASKGLFDKDRICNLRPYPL